MFLSGLKELQFGMYFNQPLEIDIFPSSLKFLCISGLDYHRFEDDGFNQQVKLSIFPSGSEELHFGCGFDQPLKVGIFPSSLKKLTFATFNHPIIRGVLPDG
jgi:hypothetical protein